MTPFDFRLNRQLWAFLAVAEEQNFGRAAARLNMSQPPLSEHIKTLETALGVTLFNRSRRGTSLTPAGAAILPAVRRFADQAAELERTVREIASGQTGVLNIGAITSAMLETLPPLLEALHADFPSLTVRVREIDSVEAVPALQSGDVDLAFFRLDGAPGPGLDGFPVEYDVLSVAVAKDHSLAGRTEVSLIDLAGEPLVMSSRSVSPVYFDRIVAACVAHGLNPRISHEVRSIASQIAYVGCGQGLALVPASVVRLTPENVTLLRLRENISVVTTAVAWVTDRHNPIAAWAIRSLRESVSA